MSESAWLTYLATLPHEQAELARHIVERCASVIADEQLRHLVEEETLRGEILALRRRLAQLEQQHNTVGPLP